ncbi:transposase [Desertibacillus haloalkaliphilus]|uniref:transposase n=1 Tax=Desertibacillus haloalkaliphilus TaxID=1328930 RepID=UPI001C269018|nr:transposase [Desertibacillus haloalkaliphilus]MBU8906512.1 transposase [Desertibacillus haloalkaliphilus]
MVRKQRVWFPHAMYHITKRGNRRSELFLDDDDRYAYLDFLEQTRLKFPFELHAYCLMTNHIHLQLQTIEDPISQIMLQLNTIYAKYFNQKYQLSGHVFQGRYGAELIDSRLYEIDVSKYIHLNPLSANMVEKAEHYHWSSYRTYIYKEHNPHITTNKILSYFPYPQPINYQKYVERTNVVPGTQ